MKKLSTLLPLACLLIVGCGQEPASVPPVIEHVADAHKLADGSYEIHLRYSITTSGGPCLSSSWFRRRTYHETNWLYVKSLEGVQSADQIILKSGVKDDVGDFTYAIKDLRGTVSFTNDTMRVQLCQRTVKTSQGGSNENQPL